MAQTPAVSAPCGNLNLTIGEPLIVSSVDEDDHADWVRIHPYVTPLPDGRLVVQINRDRDVVDAEYLVRASDDGGQTWHDHAEWPFPQRGCAPLLRLTSLDDSEVIATYGTLFAADEPDRYILPTWRSRDAGRTWSDVEAASVHLPGALPIDIYDPPAWFHDLHPNFAKNGFVKPAPPACIEPLIARFGRSRLLSHLCMHPLGGDRLLMFIYVRTRTDQPYETVCLISEDRGASWTYRSKPGAYEPRFATENFLAHGVDGLCEPAPVSLPDGSLLLVMRLGSRHPLYATTSRDEGLTWSPPRILPVWGVLPALVALPGNMLAMCAGRPDVSLSFSFDGGYRWPWTWRFLEDGKSEDPSTRNNALVSIAPDRLLLMYDIGGYHPQTPPGFTGPRRIVGHFIDITR